MDSLRYWVKQMHVDGFRFDLASILERDESGNLMPTRQCSGISSRTRRSPARSSSPRPGMRPACTRWVVSSGTVGENGTGGFATMSAASSVGDEGTVAPLADRLLGSPQIYGHKEREAEESVNFVTCHDGFTLNDLVSYNQKHNEANGEDNRDGANDNRSWNCGVEGPTDDPAIEKLRNRQVKNFLDRDDALVGSADDFDGRRSAAHPDGEQQRVLPGQRDQLV